MVKKVFISHPVSGAVEANLENSLRWARYAILKGNVPFAPYIVYLGALDEYDDDERLIGRRHGIEILAHCDELWVCGDDISTGMGEEIYRATSYQIPVIYKSNDEIRDVALPAGVFTPRRRLERPATGGEYGKPSSI
jgi:hypothetical protein